MNKKQEEDQAELIVAEAELLLNVLDETKLKERCSHLMDFVNGTIHEILLRKALRDVIVLRLDKLMKKEKKVV